MPSFATSLALTFVMSRPSNITRPADGLYSLLMQLNKLVLPAPLGPIKPQIDPSSTVNDKPFRATIPPNRSDNSDTDSL